MFVVLRYRVSQQAVRGNPSPWNDTDIVCAGNDVRIMIFTTDDKYGKEAESFLAEKLGINKLSVSSRVLSDIPTNGAGKVQYKELEKYYAE